MLYLNDFSPVVKILDIFFLTHPFECICHSQAESSLLVSEKSPTASEGFVQAKDNVVLFKFYQFPHAAKDSSFSNCMTTLI